MSGLMDELIQDNVEISNAAKEMIKDLGDSHGKEMYDLLVEVTNLRKFVEEELHALRKNVDEVRAECHSRHASNGNASTSTSCTVVGTHNIKVPKPDMYNGTRNATMVENFLFGLEQYYKALGIVDDGAKIANAPNFLHESAQLWWHRKHAEWEKDRTILHTWRQFKAELRKHFVLHNANMEARGKLRRLRQIGSIPDYIKEFTTLMLEIEDLSDKDALFHFRDGLKDWAKIELDRRNVRTLDDAIAAAKALIDIYFKEKKTRVDEGEAFEPKEWNSKQDEKYGKTPFANRDTTPPTCFLCKGPHRTRECPKRNKLSAIVANPREEEEVPIKGTAQLGAIRYLSAMKSDSSKEPQEGGWLYVDATFNNKAALAMLDAGATHNVMNPEEAG
ncbi:uncharacterized protein E5676_scaffold349G00560 [Cucumis melo var. makuwa]|uniref:Retrotransposon gag domain-containing protein n=3 Tax=Cucumis melo TaxID=3656 RepID=A0A5A7SY30_CUCMM|nr:uncharacterized protein E6C27_scaffold56G001640 [Cucumis melo var. makuwa]TYK30443.1 uncharacterized protein E5676_scaffold349G00560 [Cucumis melo var. makuwa]